MKKLLCFTLSAVLAAALAVPAFADTSVPPTSAPQTNVTQSSTDQKAETTVQFKIDPAYTVTIPGTVELTKKTDADTKKITYEEDFDITAADVRLNEGKTLRISLESDYKLASGATKLDYTVTAKQGTAAAKPVNSEAPVCADFETKTGEQTVTLHFAASNPLYAGDYSDTVTFNLAVYPQN